MYAAAVTVAWMGGNCESRMTKPIIIADFVLQKLRVINCKALHN